MKLCNCRALSCALNALSHAIANFPIICECGCLMFRHSFLVCTLIALEFSRFSRISSHPRVFRPQTFKRHCKWARTQLKPIDDVMHNDLLLSVTSQDTNTHCRRKSVQTHEIVRSTWSTVSVPLFIATVNGSSLLLFSRAQPSLSPMKGVYTSL